MSHLVCDNRLESHYRTDVQILLWRDNHGTKSFQLKPKSEFFLAQMSTDLHEQYRDHRDHDDHGRRRTKLEKLLIFRDSHGKMILFWGSEHYSWQTDRHIITLHHNKYTHHHHHWLDSSKMIADSQNKLRGKSGVGGAEEDLWLQFSILFIHWEATWGHYSVVQCSAVHYSVVECIQV